jgi:WD40 repeat protein
MAAHPYGLRSKLNTQSPSIRTTPSASPILPKTGGGLSRKPRLAEVSLQLQKVIGTTTNSPSGLSCCPAINSYAYCAGAVAVLAKVDAENAPSHRYYKARPTAPSLNPPTSHYENSPASTPSKRRTSTFPLRKGQDEYSGSSFGREWLDESGGHTWSARERIKAASCVSLSRDGRWLAVGETGYNPRVLLFSTAEDSSSEIPTSIVCDHTYGVRCIAFSPDMKYLATLGNFNDGFLFIWSLNQKTGQLTLHSANKCTTTVSDMTWCGNNLVTVGTRHVKLWHLTDSLKRSPIRQPRFRRSETLPSSPGPTPLSGRNCLLGSMVDSTFTSVLPVDATIVILGTETGHLCLIDTSQTVLELKVLKKFDISITSIAYLAKTQQLLLGTSLGLLTEDLNALRKKESSTQTKNLLSGSQQKQSRISAVRRSLGFLSPTSRHVTAVGTMQEHTVTLDSEGSLQIQQNQSEDGQNQPIFAAHNSIIQGVQSLPSRVGLGDFFTWSKNAEIKFWDVKGNLLNRESLDLGQTESDGENFENELNRMQFAEQLNGFVAGDRFGMLKLIKNPQWRVVHTIRAHSAEVTGIAIHHSDLLVATCSRDRMVQLFQINNDNFELLQTMDDHVGAVNQVLFTSNGEKLLSCSTDRSLIIRDRISRDQDGVQTSVYLSTKVLTLKASPLSMTPSTENCLLVSTMDRRITKIDHTAGTLLDSFKVGDSENDDTVSLNTIICNQAPEGVEGFQRVVTGYCSMDKSIRVYSEKNVSLLGRESGHTEGVSDIALLDQPNDEGSSRQSTIVSTGLDGTIMIWTFSKATSLSTQDASPERPHGLGISGEDPESPGVKPSPATLPPLRKVLTKMDIAELTRPKMSLSPSSPRSLSPIRLKRKTSRLALSTTVEDVENASPKSGEIASSSKSPQGEKGPKLNPRRSPSPPPKSHVRPKPQRSRTELSKDNGYRAFNTQERSPSPPPFTISVPTTPKHRQKPNNGRLRRPPSVPTDLRGQAMAQGRRQSMSQASDFGSLSMATEQACRMLKTYRRKLNSSKEPVDLDDLEDEVTIMLKVVRERKDRTPVSEGSRRRLKAKAATESDMDQLAVLMGKVNVTEPINIEMNSGKDVTALKD